MLAAIFFLMFRAIRVFRKLGIDVTPMVAPGSASMPPNIGMAVSRLFQTMVIESIKIADYRVRGWI